jgi:type I restriction enzyme S subunit
VQEQQKILERASWRIDQIAALVGEAGATIELLKERRSALISAAVTGKIDVRNWQPEAESAEYLPMAAEEPAAYETSEP